jgi:hypothetical protein
MVSKNIYAEKFGKQLAFPPKIMLVWAKMGSNICIKVNQ